MEINIDNEFWSDFVQEAFEHIEDIEANVITLEQNPNDMDIIHTMFRAFHTIKGLSGFVEHILIQEIAHNTETLMDLCRKQVKQVTKEIVDAILKSADFIRTLCDDLDSYKNDEYVQAIYSHIKVLEGLSVPDEAAPNQENNNQETTETPAEFIQEVQTENFEQENQEYHEEQPQENNEEIQEEQHQEFFQEQSPAEFSNESQTEFQEQNQEYQEEPSQEEQNTDQFPEETVYTEKSLEGLASLDLQEIIRPDEEVDEEELKKEEEAFLQQEAPVQNNFVPEITPKQEPKTENSPISAVNPPAKKGANPSEEFMKVANYKIDHLVNMIGELIINQSLLDQHISHNYSGDNQLISNMSSFLGITRELQYLSMSLRMVSLKSTFNKLSRIARDTIKELGKDVEFVTSGESTEIDRVVTEKLLDPLVHLIKNAISHGVEEDPNDRINQGKNKKAKVELNAYNKRGKIFIEVKDDGRGIDTQIVYQKALEKGIINPGQMYTEDEIKEFILLPGFSTAKVVDNISGRGVGMDVVKNQILKIGGKIDIKSTLHKGSCFTLEVPVNHAIMNGTVIEINKQYFIIPTINVREILQPKDSDWISTQQQNTMLKVREHIVPIVPDSLLFPENKISEAQQPSKLVILLELDQELRALPITNVINRQEVVVKPVGEEFANLRFIAGMSILGNGQVSLILDVDYLFKKGGTE